MIGGVKLRYPHTKNSTNNNASGEEKVAQSIGGDLSKAGIKRDLYDTVLKVLTGFGIRRQDPYQAFRFKLGKYSKNLVMQKLHLPQMLQMQETYKEMLDL